MRTASVRVPRVARAGDGTMDLLEAKSRIAEALVESIFRRARYQIRPYRSDAFPLRFGREDFSPDFCVAPAPETGTGQELLVEVKYRPSAYQFLSVENQRGDRSVFLMARRNWPNLYFVLVTDRPEPLVLPGIPPRRVAPGRAVPDRGPRRAQGAPDLPAQRRGSRGADPPDLRPALRRLALARSTHE